MDKLKKRILITFGDSFTHGLQKEKDKCLEYSFGYELSKSIGMDEYLNFAEPSLGNETIWKEFLVRNPRETFKNHDVYVVFIASYFVRFTIPVNGGYNTLSYGSSNENIMKEWIISNEDKSVEILEKYNTDTLREILLTFNDWNWKWILGFNNVVDQDVFLKSFRFAKNNIIPPAFKKGIYHGAPIEYHCNTTHHLNKEGYGYISNHVQDYIKRFHAQWIFPITNTKSFSSFEYPYNLNFKLTNRTPL